MIEVYSKPNCPDCTRAKSLLTSKGIEFNEYVIGVDADRDTLVERFPQARTAPIIVVDGMFLGGLQQLNENISTFESRQLLCG
jgi:glutaredoxin